MKVFLKVAVLVFLSLSLALCALPASAGGSDSPTPYTVDQSGVTLPVGQVFQSHSHVNVRLSDGRTLGIHFDPNNNQPGGAWIGEGFIPWSAFGLSPADCVVWVQLAEFNEHYGEGGQSPVCVGEDECPDPVEEPSEEPTVEPTVEPSVEPTVEPSEEPAGEVTEEPEPTQPPVEEPTGTPTSPTESPVIPEEHNEPLTKTPETPTPPASPDSATSSERIEPASEDTPDRITVREEPEPVTGTKVAELAQTGADSREILSTVILLTAGVGAVWLSWRMRR